MAYESQAAAFADETAGRLRSAASRFYYAAYQAVTALLHLVGRQPPLGDEEGYGREAWSHRTTPDMILTDLNRYIRKKAERENLFRILRFLYKVRVISDYIGSQSIDRKSFNRLAKESRYVVTVVKIIIEKETA